MLSRIYLSRSENQTMRLAIETVKSLHGRGIIALYGKIGTGKTVFAKGCAGAIGVEEKTIKSPTFSFIRECGRRGRKMYHCDFYRISGDDEILHHSLDEILRKREALVIIEWAENLASALPACRIDIFFEYKGRNLRRLTIMENPDVKWIYKLYEKYRTPKHVIKHMEKVAEFARDLAIKLIKKGGRIDLKRVTELALLHDLLKPISFRNWNSWQFGQPPAAKKLWGKIRKKYGAGNDVCATADILRSLGKRDLADSILTQQFSSIISKKIVPKTLEEKIVYYADKRVKHSKIVSLKERFRDGRRRYWPSGKAPAAVNTIERKIFDLEKQLGAKTS